MCDVNGCDKKVLARKLCSMHYCRLTTKGSTDDPDRSKSMIDRFWQKVDKIEEDQCWNWKAQKTKQGYGRFRSHIGSLAHRYSWVIHNRELEDYETWENKYVIMHSCDNPSCVNPNHLSLGTSKLNAMDRDAKKRHKTNPRKGEKNSLSTITNETAKMVYITKGKHQDIADTYDVSLHIVRDIKCGRRWQCATEFEEKNSYELG